MLLSNEIILQRCNQLVPLLEHADIVGYVAARNTRIMSDAIAEYLQRRDELIVKYGKQIEATGEIALSTDSENFSKFIEELKPYAEVEQEVNIVTLKYEQAIGLLSGSELLELDWMFVE